MAERRNLAQVTVKAIAAFIADLKADGWPYTDNFEFHRFVAEKAFPEYECEVLAAHLDYAADVGLNTAPPDYAAALAYQDLMETCRRKVAEMEAKEKAAQESGNSVSTTLIVPQVAVSGQGGPSNGPATAVHVI